MSKKDRIRSLLERNPGTPAKENTVKQELIQDVPIDIQVPVSKKKATFDLDAELHMRLKIFSATRGKKMVEVVETALKFYMDEKEK